MTADIRGSETTVAERAHASRNTYLNPANLGGCQAPTFKVWAGEEEPAHTNPSMQRASERRQPSQKASCGHSNIRVSMQSCLKACAHERAGSRGDQE